MEKIAEQDDALTEKYLKGEKISLEELRATLRKATIANTLVPVLCGSALKNKGVQLMLDAVLYYLPSPIELPAIEGTHPKSQEAIARHADDNEPFSALAFKLANDPFVGQLVYFRVYSGILEKGSYVLNASTGNKERLGRIVRMHANQREEVDAVYAGDIAAGVGLKGTTTGNTICDLEHPVLLENIVFPEPVISMRIEPKTRQDQEKMSIALHRLAEEDPTFRLKTDEETADVIISGMGELHLEIIVDRMRREFGVEANTGKPQVAYREAIHNTAEAEGKYIRQTGGKGQYGHVWLRVEPTERGSGFEFVNSIKGGIIPQEFIPAVGKGVKEATERGVYAGYPLVDVRVTLYDGSFHDVDSSEMAFKMAGSLAFQEAARRGGLYLLEPLMSIETIAPDDFLGDVTGDLSSKRGQILEMGERGTMKTVKALVPLSEMFGYATQLRSMTQGRGSYTMEFHNYSEVPSNIAQGIVEGKTR